jgi:hypothetical protein
LVQDGMAEVVDSRCFWDVECVQNQQQGQLCRRTSAALQNRSMRVVLLCSAADMAVIALAVLVVSDALARVCFFLLCAVCSLVHDSIDQAAFCAVGISL